MKLLRSEIKKFRRELLKKQGGICPLCGQTILQGEDTLDHDHKSGHVRRVLHRSCNTAEGKILAWAKRSRAEEPDVILENLLRYWSEDYSGNPLHPDHLTDEERLIKTYRKRMRRAKRESTKQKYRDLIQDIQKEMKC